MSRQLLEAPERATGSSAIQHAHPLIERRVKYIDGLRGIAALSVVAVHGTDWWRGSLPPGNLLGFLASLGNNGVELFFVLSGFCLAFPFLAKQAGGAKFDLVRYASRRLVRIVPPYYVAILIFGVALLAGGQVVLPTGRAIPNVWGVLQQTLFFDRNVPFLSGTFWTLPIELRWYVLFPALLWLWMRAPRAFALAIPLAFVLFRWTTAGNADLFALPAFMLGIIAAALAIGRRVPVGAAWGLFLTSLAASLWLSRIAPLSLDPPIGLHDVRDYLPLQLTLWQLTSFGFLLLAAESNKLRRLLSWWPLTRCGEASYSIYLVHMIPILAMKTLLPKVAALPEAFAGMFVAVVCGFVFWRIVEYPITETPLKDQLVAVVARSIARMFNWLRLPPSFELPRPHAHSPGMARSSVENVAV